MSRIGWRLAPIMTLTIRQFLGGKAVRVIVGLSLIPILFGAIFLLNSNGRTATDYMVNVVYLPVVIATLMPITILILATGALGNEIEDRTLPYLTLKPISRFRIVFEKFRHDPDRRSDHDGWDRRHLRRRFPQHLA